MKKIKLEEYRKFALAVVAGVGSWAAVVVASQATHITASEWLVLYGNMATALGVGAIPNAVSTDFTLQAIDLGKQLARVPAKARG